MGLRGSSPLVLVLVCGWAARVGAQQPTFTDLGVLPNGSIAQALGVSTDGSMVVGRGVPSTPPGAPLQAVRWTRTGGMVPLGVLSGGFSSIAQDVGGGSVVGMSTSSSGPRAVRSAGGPLVSLGVLPGMTESEAVAVSDDGSVIVGSSRSSIAYKAFRWTAATGMVDLPALMGTTMVVSANNLSGDGLVVVGGMNPASQPSRAYRWNGTTITDLGLLPGAANSWAVAVSTDGLVVAGNCGIANVPRAFRWTQGGGMVDLGLLPGATLSSVNDISGDGSVVIGSCNVGGPVPGAQLHAFIWTQERGMEDLNTLLHSMGVNMGALTLNNAYAVNDEATVIVGDAYQPNEGSRGWVLDLRGDSDGDGLLDHWELFGIPYLNDVNQIKRWHLPGADPAHKDLYVEVDAMAGLGLMPTAESMVVAAFSNAPLDNPDGTPGVRLHVQRDETDLAHIGVWQTNGCWPQNYNTYYDGHFGTDAERQANGGGGLYFRLAKALAYRYCLVADRAQSDVGGCGQTPGDKTVLFLGSQTLDHAQASVFMHEVGHNLGLDHGGGDGINGKPNYPSIMNYVLAYKYEWNSAFWQLDYSRAGAILLGNLNENSLNETSGIGVAGGRYADYRMPFGVSTAQGGREVRYARLDGEQVDYGSAAGTMIPDGSFTGGVVQDLNYLPSPPSGILLPATSSPGQTLPVHDDWGVVVLATPGAIGAGAAAPSYPMDELTIAARDWIDQNFPPPGGGALCYANCDASTTAPVLNVLDFACFLNRFAGGDTYANCDGSTTAPVLNVLDFACYLNRFAAGCT